MLGQMKRVGELVSSNVEALIDQATDARKMLLLLRSEIEDCLLKLDAAKGKAASRAEACKAGAASKSAEAEEWTNKAKLAMDKGREDLARAALLARESERAAVAELERECAEANSEVTEIEATIAELEKRRSETLAKLDAMPAPAKAAASPKTGSSVADRQRNRVDTLEKRAGFAAERADHVSPAQVDEELDRMQRDSAIDAELEAMRPKAKGRKAARKK